MRLWTIQTQEVWRALQSEGVWRAHQSLVPEYRLEAYQWMARQMRVRLGEAGASGQMPVWVWDQWENSRRGRPDLRCGGHLPRGTPGVRLEIEVEDDRVLLSDFELWHYVLNYWYLPRSIRDEREFQSEMRVAGLCYYKTVPLPDKAWHRKIEESWGRIFGLSWANLRYATKRDQKSIQGVIWELRLSDVRAVDPFLAR